MHNSLINGNRTIYSPSLAHAAHCSAEQAEQALFSIAINMQAEFSLLAHPLQKQKALHSDIYLSVYPSIHPPKSKPPSL